MSLSYQSLLGLSSLDSDSISTKDLDISGNLIVEGTTTLNILNVTSASIASLYAATGTFDNLIVRNQFTYNTGAQHGYILSCTGNTGTGLWIENNPSMTGDCTGNTLSNRVDTLAGGTINVTDLVTLTGTQTVINKDMTVDAFRLPTGGAVNKVLTSDATGQASWQTNVTEVTMGGDISGLSSASVVNTLAGGTIDCLDLVTENATQYMNNKTMTGTSNIIAANILRASDNAWNIGLTGSAPVLNQILTYGSDGGYWSDLNLITGPTGPQGLIGPTGSAATIINLNGNCTGPSNAVICLGASGNFNVVGRTTTGGLTLSSVSNSRVIFDSSYTKMITFADLDSAAPSGQNFDGFGNSPFGDRVRYQVKNTTTNHIFYAATSSSTSNTLMTVRGDGVVVIPKILNMNNSVQRKMICLYDGGTPSDINGHHFYGFGVAAGTFITQVLSTPDYFKWYAGVTSTTSNEAMSLSGTGNLVVPGNVSIGSGVNTSLTVAGIAHADTIHTNVWENPKSQGSWISWNRNVGSGRTTFACQQGGGAGGFEWINYDGGNVLTSPNPLMTLDASGNLTVAGSLTASFAGDNDVTLTGIWFYNDDDPVEWAVSIQFTRRNGIVSYYIPGTNQTLDGASTFQQIWFFWGGGLGMPDWAQPVDAITIIAPMIINGVATSAMLNFQNGSTTATLYYTPINGATFVGSCRLYETSGSYIGNVL